MKNFLTEQADTGDIDAMYKLGELLLSEDEMQAKKYIVKAAEKNYLPALILSAKISQEERNFAKALEFYQKAAELGDVKSMEEIVNMCEAGKGVKENDSEILDEVLKIIEKNYNDIYSTTDFFGRTFYLGSRRNEEYTPQYSQAIERRRIANRIRKLKLNG